MMIMTVAPAHDFGTWMTAEGRFLPLTSRVRESYPLTLNSAIFINTYMLRKVFIDTVRKYYVRITCTRWKK